MGHNLPSYLQGPVNLVNSIHELRQTMA